MGVEDAQASLPCCNAWEKTATADSVHIVNKHKTTASMQIQADSSRNKLLTREASGIL